MGKRIATVLGSAALVLCVPAWAQDAATEGAASSPAPNGEAEDFSPDAIGEAMLGAFGEMFSQEPLTAKQEARLPAARSVVDKIIPPGALGEVMGSMFDGFFGPLMGAAHDIGTADAAALLGYEAQDLGLDQETAVEVAALIDPAMQERNARMKDAMPRIMSKMMTAMEPTMKDAMSEIYAVYFDAGQLSEIGAFFSTATGGYYARQSLKMSSDPRFLAGMMRAMPGMMATFADMEGEMTALVADLPERRKYADLDANERARIAQLTGLSQEEIEAGMDLAASGAGTEEGWNEEGADPVCCGPDDDGALIES